jgi:hypothetical protein
MRGPKRQPIETRFAKYLVKRGEDECWDWTGPTSRGGYPTLGKGGKGAGQMSARLLAYRMVHGEPEGEVVVLCGTASCLNPKHLALRAMKPFLLRDQRFHERVKKGKTDDCWPWQGTVRKGYGFLSMNRKTGPVAAHRIAWEIANGEIPPGLLVRQSCGNRLCCNPAHLFLALNSIDGPEVSAKAVKHWLLLPSLG